MKPDEFEQKLARQPIKPIPANWRTEILAAAQEAQAIRPSPFPQADVRLIRHSSFVIRHSWLSTLFWPHPKAWAGLAAAWILVFAMHFSLRDPAPALAGKAPPPSPEAVAELRQQQRMLAELIGPAELRLADRQRDSSPKPRSEWVPILAA
jgi:hypothetical protein